MQESSLPFSMTPQSACWISASANQMLNFEALRLNFVDSICPWLDWMWEEFWVWIKFDCVSMGLTFSIEFRCFSCFAFFAEKVLGAANFSPQSLYPYWHFVRGDYREVPVLNCNYYLKCTGLNMGPDEALLDWTIGEPLIPITLGLEARMMSFCEISPAANFHLMKVFFQFEILWNVFYFRENSNFLWFQFLSFLSVRWLLDILPKWSSWI